MSDFIEGIRKREGELEQTASSTIREILKEGADECSVYIGGTSGLSVSARDGAVENIEFNRGNGLSISVYRGHRRGSSSTTDLRPDAIRRCIESAMTIASFAGQDKCAGVADPELLCREFRDLKVLYPVFQSPDQAASIAVRLDKLGLSHKGGEIRGSDGSYASASVYTGCYADSNGFCHADSSSYCTAGLTLLGERGGAMERGSGFTVSRRVDGLLAPEQIAGEALANTLGRLGPKPVATGPMNVVFAKGAVQSLIGTLAGAISGGALFRRTSFLCDALGKEILPSYVGIHEDPFVLGGLGSDDSDCEGVRSQPMDIVSGGVLKAYLLASYSSRKLGMKSNGHASGIYNWDVSFEGRTLPFDELLGRAGEGIVVEELMGQGTDLASGNYSHGASGYYFKDGRKVHPVAGITIAGNLRDMYRHMEFMSDSFDPRYRVHTGAILVTGMTVSGS
ncbi:MAG: metallopeptidase TldD-related protein [Succinivibrio sp.]